MRALLFTAASTAVLFAALAMGSRANGARAEGGPKGASPEAVKAIPLPADAVRRLKSGDPAQIRSALDDVRIAAKGGAPAVPAIVELIERGLPSDLTQAAIETLGDTESEGASAALSWYARHRNISLRRAAVQALARTHGAVAVKSLRAVLSDPDSEVRGLAATGLGALRAKEAVGDLFVALDHKVTEASGAIGQLCVRDECERLAAKLGGGRFPFEVVTSGLEHALFRTPPDVSDDVKVKIIGRVRELGTAEANHFLRDVQARWPKNGSARVRQAIDQAVLATTGSPGSGAGEGSL